MEEKIEAVRRVLSDIADIDAGKVSAATTFAELDMDSLDMIEAVCAIEDELGVEIETDGHDGNTTIGEFLKGIQQG